jgi:hypothetical protein
MIITYEIHEYRTEERELIYFVKAKTKRAALDQVKKGYVDETDEDVIETNVTARWVEGVEKDKRS